MIYHHLPDDDKWQLLQTPIKMTQYLEIPHLHRLYFDLNIELVSPRNQYHLDLIPALVMAKKKTDPEIYTTVVAFKIETKHIPSSPISYHST
ncbi:unnamed protein product [Rotaria sp. Silwood1]|nr:unnamed protein product [Rotaria sp. Silwood1]